MYSKARSTREREETVTPPPGYAGNRFFTTGERTEMTQTPVRGKLPENLGFLSGIGKEDLLIIGLILILAGEGKAESDTLLMLILLLFV